MTHAHTTCAHCACTLAPSAVYTMRDWQDDTVYIPLCFRCFSDVDDCDDDGTGWSELDANMLLWDAS